MRREGRLWRLFSRIVSNVRISPLLMRLATRIDRPLLRLSRGRWRLSFVIPCLLLRCRGARSGLLREVPLLYVPLGGNFLLVGSGGGSITEPAWCRNLRANSAVEVVCAGTTERRVASLLDGSAREAAWAAAVRVYPGYTAYQARLARQIPLFILRKPDEAAA